MVKALQLLHPSCRISTFTADRAIAVCSARYNCPKKRRKFQLEPSCFVNGTEEVEWCQYTQRL
jgi:hypothetical protein